MNEQVVKEFRNLKCPSCGSNAFYRYGRSRTGKKRFLCLMCGMQFTSGFSAPKTSTRPKCPACDRTMNVYMRKEEFTRYRCSGYPGCRTFYKQMKTQDKEVK